MSDADVLDEELRDNIMLYASVLAHAWVQEFGAAYDASIEGDWDWGRWSYESDLRGRCADVTQGGQLYTSTFRRMTAELASLAQPMVNATSLDDLFSALTSSAIWLSNLPTFGGPDITDRVMRYGPEKTRVLVRSWDAKRMIIEFEDDAIAIVERDDV